MTRRLRQQENATANRPSFPFDSVVLAMHMAHGTHTDKGAHPHDYVEQRRPRPCVPASRINPTPSLACGSTETHSVTRALRALNTKFGSIVSRDHFLHEDSR